MQTAQIRAQKPLADGAGHTLRRYQHLLWLPMLRASQCFADVVIGITARADMKMGADFHPGSSTNNTARVRVFCEPALAKPQRTPQPVT